MTATTRFFAVTCLFALGISATSFAQQMYASNQVKSPVANNTIMTDENNSAITVDAATPAIQNKFAVLFPHATDLKWTGSGDNYLVSFLVNGHKGTASFNTKAELNYVITNCSLEQLPAAFSKAIKNSYAAYQLFNAKEIKAHGAVAYQAILEDSKGFITLKYTAGEVEVVQQVKKQ